MGKRLAEHNHKKREEQRKEQAKLEKTASGVNQYYGIGAVIALGVIGGLGYYIYQSKKGEVLNRALQDPAPQNPPQQPRPQAQPQSNKFEMDLNLFCTIKMDKKSTVNNLYQATVISVLVVGYLMLGKKKLKVSPASIQHFDLEDMGKLVAIVAASEMTREYLIKQKILADHINV